MTDEDVIRLRVEGTEDALAAFRRVIGRRRGLRVTAAADVLHLEIDAAQIEAIGPRVEVAAIRSGLTVHINEINAEVVSAGLDARPSRIWAGIGNAADQRAVDRDRGSAPSVELFEFVRVEMEGDRRVAVDTRPGLIDRPTSVPADFFPTKFDDASWHEESTAEANQPFDHAWTHMALYLTWLIRHDLVDRHRIGRRAERIRQGEIVDGDLMQWIDAKLTSDQMTDAGAEFSRASYSTYLGLYDRVFGEEPAYSVAADAGSYARIEPELDALWSTWNGEHRG